MAVPPKLKTIPKYASKLKYIFLHYRYAINCFDLVRYCILTDCFSSITTSNTHPRRTPTSRPKQTNQSALSSPTFSSMARQKPNRHTPKAVSYAAVLWTGPPPHRSQKPTQAWWQTAVCNYSPPSGRFFCCALRPSQPIQTVDL